MRRPPRWDRTARLACDQDPPATAVWISSTIAGLDHLAGELDPVHDRPLARRAVGDDAHPVDAEEDRPAVRLGIERLVQRQQGREERLGVRLVLLLRRERGEQRPDDRPHTTLERLQHDVAGEPVGHDDVDAVGHDVATFDVADEVDARAP